jgi:hypothetical protein
VVILMLAPSTGENLGGCPAVEMATALHNSHAPIKAHAAESLSGTIVRVFFDAHNWRGLFAGKTLGTKNRIFAAAMARSSGHQAADRRRAAYSFQPTD